jgi:hypothetical protein
MKWYKEITIGWTLVPHPLGTGFALRVDRGIPAEGHYHVLTKHDNSFLDLKERLERVIATKSWPKEAIHSFTNMVSQLAACGGYQKDLEVLAAAFMASLLERLYDAAKNTHSCAI